MFPLHGIRLQGMNSYPVHSPVHSLQSSVYTNPFTSCGIYLSTCPPCCIFCIQLQQCFKYIKEFCIGRSKGKSVLYFHNDYSSFCKQYHLEYVNIYTRDCKQLEVLVFYFISKCHAQTNLVKALPCLCFT